MDPLAMAHTREAAGYRAGTGFKRCWNCEHLTLPSAEEGPVTCALLALPVEPTAPDRLVAATRTAFGRLDIVVANHARSSSHPLAVRSNNTMQPKAAQV
jgi:hypothetical protein